jgi:hypothetical protein
MRDKLTTHDLQNLIMAFGSLIPTINSNGKGLIVNKRHKELEPLKRLVDSWIDEARIRKLKDETQDLYDRGLLYGPIRT